MRRISAQVTGHGLIEVPDHWTDDAIEADPDGFEDVLLEALPDAIGNSQIDFVVDDAVPDEAAGRG